MAKLIVKSKLSALYLYRCLNTEITWVTLVM